MKLISFQLTMPNVGSWNGKWTGADRKYYVIRSLSEKYIKTQPHLQELLAKGKDHWHYSWNDGWGANVTAEVVDSKEAARRRKVSAGFSGYEWMIDSIVWYGEIMNTTQRKQYLESQKKEA